MARKGQKSELTMERQAKAWQMRVEGHTQRSIASELGITQQSVGALLKNAREEYRREFLDDMDSIGEEQVISIMEVARDALDSWKRSKKHGESLTGDTKQFGDIRYLKIYLRCQADVRSLLGLETTMKLNFDVDINSLSQYELNKISQAKDYNDFLQIPAMRKGT